MSENEKLKTQTKWDPPSALSDPSRPELNSVPPFTISILHSIGLDWTVHYSLY